ncbi:alpha-amylase family glycosyl hydrolase, partial [Clostridium sp.]|uniref:alpha-amylase family glycosyl hydrolase n=1 Tax=Clostridium sp. TaxID=1506 RepID=UPI0026108DEA
MRKDLYTNNEADKLLIIKASLNEFFLEEEIQLIALIESRFGLKEYKNINWSVEVYENVELKNNIIKVEKDFNKEFLTIYCEDIETGIKYRRKFPIIFQEINDKLIHFIKNDSDYEGYGYKWSLWSYSEKGSSKEINFSSESDFGICAFVNEDFVIARRKAWGDNFYNDWSEQTHSFKLSSKSKNYYIIHGVNKILTDISEVVDYINPRIEIALMDEENKITAFLSKTPKEDVDFFIYLNGVLQKNIKYIVNKSLKMIEFYNLGFNFKAEDLIEIRADRTYLPCKVTLRNYLNKYNIVEEDFGVTFFKDSIGFKIFSPTSYKCELCLYNNFYNKNKDVDKVILMNKDDSTGSYIVNIPREDNENQYYLYRFYFKDINLYGNVIDKITYAIDPYAKSLGINGEKGYLIDINNITNMPLGWKSYKRPTINKKDAIIYEVHLRDFTIEESSGVSKNNRGKFLGFSEENTSITYKEKVYKTGLNHVEELGITHIHLMPIFDFGSVDERKSNRKENRNWGYDPKNFNAPEGSYSTEPYNPISRTIELREMIKKIHSKNIKVIMDVVYNHMEDTSNFDSIVPSYYFRTDYRG